MAGVHEPTLFFSIYMHRHLPRRDAPDDPRLLLLKELDRCARVHGLEAKVPGLPYSRASDIDLVTLHRSRRDFELLLNIEDDWCQCLVYSYLDALLVQLWHGVGGWTGGALAQAWDHLLTQLRRGFSGDALEAAWERTFGASVVYWAFADADPALYASEVEKILGPRASPLCTETDIGPLWQADRPIFPEAPGVAQDAWVLLTPSNGTKRDRTWRNDQANERFNLLTVDRPPPFASVALARNKIRFEWKDYAEAREHLGQMAASLDRRAAWVLRTQQYHGEALSNLRGRESAEFQEKLTRAYNTLADFHQHVTRTRGVLQTLVANRRNFLTKCPLLISADAAERIVNSSDPAQEAINFLVALKRDEFFRYEAGRMQNLGAQVETDLSYAGELLDRVEGAIASGRAQLEIAGEREVAEMGADRAMETSSVVASLAAVVAVELLTVENTVRDHPVLAANVILLAATASFALAQLLSALRRPKTWLHRGSVGAAAGFGLSALAVSLWDGVSPLALVTINVGIFLVGFVAGAALHGWLELRSRLRQRRRRDRRERVKSGIVTLFYAAEELPDLLEDLPATTVYRLKREQSFLGKIERKNEERARERGITVKELEDQGDAYDARDVGDPIGIRYVVAPWRIDDVVARVRDVTHAVNVEYKNDTETVGRTIVDGQEFDDQDYQGKYRGFRSNYKSVHVDVDLWGVGARKDVNLMAEIQVRTPIENMVANWFHDIVYKERQVADKLGLFRSARRASLPFNEAIFPELLEPKYGISVDDTRTMHVSRDVRVLTWDGRVERIPFEDCEPYVHTAPWFVRFFDLWHPFLNRPIARFLIGLSDLELWLFQAHIGSEEEPEARRSR